jgi:hypothetical protein
MLILEIAGGVFIGIWIWKFFSVDLPEWLQYLARERSYARFEANRFKRAREQGFPLDGNTYELEKWERAHDPRTAWEIAQADVARGIAAYRH